MEPSAITEPPPLATITGIAARNVSLEPNFLFSRCSLPSAAGRYGASRKARSAFGATAARRWGLTARRAALDHRHANECSTYADSNKEDQEIAEWPG